MMKHPFTSRYFLGIALLGVAAPVSLVTTVIAQTPVQSAPQTAKPAAAPAKAANTRQFGDVYIRNANGRFIYDMPSGTVKMTDNVRIWQDREDFTLYADEVTYNEKTNEAVATGNLRVESRDSTITGKLIRANFNDKVIIVLNNVVMKSHGSNDGLKGSAPGRKGDEKKADSGNRTLREELAHKASSMTCDRIDYNYENREALASGSIRMRQGENFGTCDQIMFDEENNVAQLRGNVSFGNEKSQTIRGREVTVWMDDSRVATNNPVAIQIPTKEDEKNRKKATPKRDFGPAPVMPDAWLEELKQPIAPAPTPVPITGDDSSPDDAPRPAASREAPPASDAPDSTTAEDSAKPTPVAAAG